MPNYSKKNSFSLLVVFNSFKGLRFWGALLLTVLILTAIFFSGVIDERENYITQASFWNTIRAWVTINPLGVNVSAPAEVEIGKVFKVEAKLINKGEEKIENARGEIFLADKLILLKKNRIQKIGVIPSKKEKKISWSVKGEEIGSYIVIVSVSGELRGYGVSAQDDTRVEVKESLRGAQSTSWFQNLLDFFQKWF